MTSWTKVLKNCKVSAFLGIFIFIVKSWRECAAFYCWLSLSVCFMFHFIPFTQAANFIFGKKCNFPAFYRRELYHKYSWTINIIFLAVTNEGNQGAVLYFRLVLQPHAHSLQTIPCGLFGMTSWCKCDNCMIPHVISVTPGELTGPQMLSHTYLE